MVRAERGVAVAHPMKASLQARAAAVDPAVRAVVAVLRVVPKVAAVQPEADKLAACRAAAVCLEACPEAQVEFLADCPAAFQVAHLVAAGVEAVAAAVVR